MMGSILLPLSSMAACHGAPSPPSHIFHPSPAPLHRLIAHSLDPITSLPAFPSSPSSFPARVLNEGRFNITKPRTRQTSHISSLSERIGTALSSVCQAAVTAGTVDGG